MRGETVVFNAHIGPPEKALLQLGPGRAHILYTRFETGAVAVLGTPHGRGQP